MLILLVQTSWMTSVIVRLKLPLQKAACCLLYFPVTPILFSYFIETLIFTTKQYSLWMRAR